MGYPHFIQDPALGHGSTPQTIELVGGGTYADGAAVIRSGTAITAVSNTTPMVVTAAGHGFATGGNVVVGGVATATDANASTWLVTVLTANTFELDGSVADGAGTGGYCQAKPAGMIVIDGALAHGDSDVAAITVINVYAGDYTPGDDPITQLAIDPLSDDGIRDGSARQRAHGLIIPSRTGFILERDDSATDTLAATILYREAL